MDDKSSQRGQIFPGRVYLESQHPGLCPKRFLFCFASAMMNYLQEASKGSESFAMGVPVCKVPLQLVAEIFWV